jgi:hypothetical protein
VLCCQRAFWNDAKSVYAVTVPDTDDHFAMFWAILYIRRISFSLWCTIISSFFLFFRSLFVTFIFYFLFYLSFILCFTLISNLLYLLYLIFSIYLSCYAYEGILDSLMRRVKPAYSTRWDEILRVTGHGDGMGTARKPLVWKDSLQALFEATMQPTVLRRSRTDVQLKLMDNCSECCLIIEY